MKVKTFLAACVGMLGAVGPAHAELIDFSTYAAGTTFNGPLEVLGVTFQSSTNQLMIGNFGGGNALCAFDGSGCTGTLSIAFANGANALKFTYSGDDVADSDVLYEGQSNVLAFSGRHLTDGDPATTADVSFNFRNILFMAISSNDPRGVAFNSFSFTPTVTAGVPEPATWAMMIMGFGLIGAGLRRRSVKVAYQTA